MDSSDKWEVLKKAYNDYSFNYKGVRTPKIPKILHQIWLGGQPFPRNINNLLTSGCRNTPIGTTYFGPNKRLKILG